MVFKGFFIELTFEGWFQYYSEAEERFLKFDTLSGCKENIINNEIILL